MVKILNSDAFSGLLPAPGSVGISPIFRGKIKFEDQSLHCYLKPLPDQLEIRPGVFTENREILSEALGYSLAKHAGYSVPETAGIIMLTAEQMPSHTLGQLKALTPSLEAQGDYLAWFSQDMQHPSLLRTHVTPGAPKHLVDLQLKHLSGKLAAHKETAAVVTFDEWSENSDRNLGNLLESADGRLGLIDHGRLFRSPAWSPERLGSSPGSAANVLMSLVDEFNHSPRWSERTPNLSARGLAYNNLAVSWRRNGADAAQKLLAEFLDAQEIELVIRFLGSRLEPDHYNQTVGLLA